MKQTIYRAVSLAAAGWLALGFSTSAGAQDAARTSSARPEKTVNARATGELTGLTGTMTIEISGGKHSYAFDYSLG